VGEGKEDVLNEIALLYKKSPTFGKKESGLKKKSLHHSKKNKKRKPALLTLREEVL